MFCISFGRCPEYYSYKIILLFRIYVNQLIIIIITLIVDNIDLLIYTKIIIKVVFLLTISQCFFFIKYLIINCQFTLTRLVGLNTPVSGYQWKWSSSKWWHWYLLSCHSLSTVITTVIYTKLTFITINNVLYYNLNCPISSTWIFLSNHRGKGEDSICPNVFFFIPNQIDLEFSSTKTGTQETESLIKHLE